LPRPTPTDKMGFRYRSRNYDLGGKDAVLKGIAS